MAQLITKAINSVLLISLAFGTAVPAFSAEETAEFSGVAGKSNLGLIRGIVRDEAGKPIADAVVAIFRLGTSKLLRQARSAADGSYTLRIVPGKYTVLAVAQGFNPATLPQVEVGRASEQDFGFKLARAGSGNTLPEKRLDRSNPKWVIRSSQMGRSIYLNTEGDLPVGESVSEPAEVDVASHEDEAGSINLKPGQTIAETFAASSERGTYAGVNVATHIALNEKTDLILAGQATVGRNAPKRLDTQLTYRPNDSHTLRFVTSFGELGTLTNGEREESLGQFSFRAIDEWKVRDGIIFVYGLDYSRFTGAGDDFAIAPRLGFQYDIDSKTRFRSAYTTQTDDRTWAREIALEDAQISFREPAFIEDFVIEDGEPLLNNSRRLEFGIERVLDNSSSIEAGAFFDGTLVRGVRVIGMPFGPATIEGSEIAGNQQGNASGLRVVYARRLNGRFNLTGGYSFGTGQRLSGEGLQDPASLFAESVFHTVFGQLDANVRTGTNIRTIFRLSPNATVFAVDPFRGRLAIYDPGLSVVLTQSLPTLGLPFRAEAIVDARNIFDLQNTVTGSEGTLSLNSQRRMVRGSILVRF
ncbi:MAG: TonB-dependent receptor [Acidobacteria bacterium]|nr:TonB-dependent receptor [Acidobacteriota bacterium]